MKYIILIFFLFFCFNVLAQQRFPTGFPTQKSTGWFEHGYSMSDSGLIVANRDTTWLAKYSGTVVFRPANKKFYYFDSTSLRWFQLVPDGIDTTSLSNRINLKLNISDTASMLLPYLRKADTTNKWVQNIYTRNDSLFKFKNGTESFVHLFPTTGSGTVTSVALSMPSAFTVTGSPITTSGTFNVSGAGTALQYIRGNGTLATTDTSMIPDFYLKARSLLSGTSPITYNSTTGAIGITNANTTGTKGAASFTSSGFSDNGSGLIDLASVVTAGTCVGCNLTIDAKGRVTAFADGSGGGGAATLNNVGAGYRWAATPTGNVKTFFTDVTGSIDSTSNANGLTYKVDTSVIATQNDIVGKSYYVAQNGLSTGNGSTIATAVSMARVIELSSEFIGGERIFFKANDTLRGSLNIKANTYVGRYDTGRAPIIAGTIRSTNSSLTWVQSGLIWKARYTTRVGRVLRNGVPERTAQSVYSEVTARPASNQVTVASLAGLGSWVTQAEVISKQYNFRFSYNTITAYNSGTGTFTLNSDNGIATGYSIKLFNHDQLISADGDWAWVNDTIYYRSPGNVNPNTLNVELSVYENGLVFENRSSNYTIEGVTFYAQAIQGIKTNKTNDITINNCNFYKQLDAAIFLDDSCTNVNIGYCKLDSIGSNGVLGGMAIKNFILDHLSIKHIATQVDPPFSRTDDIPFRNGVNGLGVMIFPNGDNGYITNCIADSLSYMGLRADCSNTIFENNSVSNFSLRQNDGGGIYVWGNQTAYFSTYGWVRPVNTTIINNVVWGGLGVNEGGPAETAHAMGIYLDNGVINTKVIGNTTYTNGGSGIYLGYDTKSNSVIGNTSYNNGEAQLRIANNTGEGGVLNNRDTVTNNVFVSLNATQRNILIFDYQAGGFNPFDSGTCVNNIFISPYTNNIIRKTVSASTNTDYTLAGARAYYLVNFGQQDSYSSAFVNDSTSLSMVKLDVNNTDGSRWSVMQQGYRSPIGKFYNADLGSHQANVYINDSTEVYYRNGAVAFNNSTTELAIIGVSKSTNNLITGANIGDVAIRTISGKVNISNDNGTSSIFTITPTNVGVGTIDPQYKIDVQTNTNGAERIRIKNASAGSNGISLLECANDGNWALQTGVVSSTYSAGFNSANDVFFSANSNVNTNFNIYNNNTGTIRFGMWDNIGLSVVEAMRINSSREIQIGSTSDLGSSKLQVTGTIQMVDGNQGAGKIMTSDANGVATWQTASSATTLYTGDGTLAGNRIVTGGANDLTFTGIDQFKIATTYFGYSKTDGTRVYSSMIGSTSAQTFQFGYSGSVVGSFPDGVAYVVDTLNNVGIGDATEVTAPLYSNGNSTNIAWGLQSENANYYKVSTITSDLTLNNLNYNLVRIDATSGNVTVTLPAASSCFGAQMGIELIFKRIDNSGNTVTIQRNGTPGTDTIDGAASFTLTTQYETKKVRASSTSTFDIY